MSKLGHLRFNLLAQFSWIIIWQIWQKYFIKRGKGVSFLEDIFLFGQLGPEKVNKKSKKREQNQLELSPDVKRAKIQCQI